MDLFNIVGSITVDNSLANQALRETGRLAQRVARDIDRAFEQVSHQINGSLIPSLLATLATLQLLEFQVNDVGNEFTVMGGKAMGSSALMTASLWTMVGVLATALIPILAVASAGIMALGAGFLSAGFGAVGFGAVAISTLGEIFTASKELTEAQKELSKAVTAEEREKALEKMREALAGLNDEQLRGVNALQDFKSYWKDFASSFETPIIDIFVDSLGLLKQIIDLSKPSIDSAIVGVDNLIASLSTNLESNDVKEFVEWMGENAGTYIDLFGRSMGNLFQGLMNLFMAFTPMTADVSGGFLELTERFREWTASLEGNQSFQNFIQYVKENTPIVIEFIKKLWDTITGIVSGLAPLGSVILDILNAVLPVIESVFRGFGDFFNSLSPIMQQIAGVIALFTPIITMVVLGITKLVGAVIAFVPKLTAMWQWIVMIINVIKGWGASMLLAMGPVGIAIAVITALIAIIVVLWNKSEKFREIVKSVWSSVKNAIATAVGAIIAFLKPLISYIGGKLVSAWEVVKKAWAVTWNIIKGVVSNGINNVRTVVNGIRSVIAWVKGVWATVSGAWSTAWAIIKATVSNAISGVRDVINNVLSPIVSTAKNIWSGISGAWSSAWGSLTGIVSGAIDGIKSSIDSVIGRASDMISSVKRASGKVKDTVSQALSSGGGSPNSPQHRNANGTNNFEGGWTTVGEQGRELVKLPQGSKVYSNHDLESALGRNKNGITQNITIVSPKSTANEIARKIKQSSQKLALE